MDSKTQQKFETQKCECNGKVCGLKDFEVDKDCMHSRKSCKPLGECHQYTSMIEMGIAQNVIPVDSGAWRVSILDCQDDELPHCAKKGLKAVGRYTGTSKSFGMDANSVLQCETYCKNTGDCLYWNYYQRKRKCYLFNRISSIEKDPDSIIASKGCTQLIIEDRFDNTIEMQYDNRFKKSLWDTVQNSKSFMLLYSQSQCLDHWEVINNGQPVATIDQCASICFETEGCLYFGYGTKMHAKQCYNAGYICKMREKNKSIDFDIYETLADKIINYSIMKYDNKCSGGSFFCSTTNINECDTPPNFAESINACVTSCEYEYGSGMVAFSKEIHSMSAPTGAARCICYPSSVSLESCTEKNMNQNCNTGNTNHNPDCFHSMYFVLKTTENILEFSEPLKNYFLSSHRGTLASHYASTMIQCCELCIVNMDCEYVTMDYETKQCYLVPAPMANLRKRTGWVSVRRNGCAKVKSNTKHFVPENTWWGDEIFV